jgi:hypothetical protein
MKPFPRYSPGLILRECMTGEIGVCMTGRVGVCMTVGIGVCMT